MIKLSVAIITYNEEKNILRCLKSVDEIADEIIILDSLSSDNTKKICQEFSPKVKFSEQEFLGHIGQKNKAIDLCEYDHILSLDADEALSPELTKSIFNVKSNWNADSYSFNRLTRYVDKWVKHGIWYPDTKIRLFKKNKAQWGGVNPHDKIIMAPGSSTHHIAGDLLHYSYNSVSDHIIQTNKFTTIAAKAMYDTGINSHFTKIYLRPFFNFFKDYFLKKGFLLGRYGLIIAVINSIYVFLKYLKLQELEKNKSID